MEYNMKVAFIGLGVMGYPMAGHLQKAGHEVTVFNRTTARADAWVTQFDGMRAITPAAAASGAEIVFICVGNDDDVRSVVLGDTGILAGLEKGSIIVDHTTASAHLAVELAAASKTQGVGFLDAPVSGGQAGAENGVLTIMVGGEANDFDRAAPVMAAFGRTVKHMGESGNGQKTKMVNQLFIAGLIQSLSEGIRFAQKSGLDANEVIDVIKGGAAQSWQLENRGPTMVEGKFDFGFAIDWMRKDLGICFEEADRIGAQTPVARLVDQFYAELQAQGHNRDDTSSLIRRL